MSSLNQVKRVGDLEVAEDFAFQERAWRAQAWGQLGVVLFLLAGILGLFGGGVLGDRKVSDSSGRLQVTHPLFGRQLSSYDLQWEIAPELIVDGQVAVWLDVPFLHGLQVERISPQPQQEVFSAGRIVYHFQADRGDEPVRLVFHLQTLSPGRGGGSAGVIGGPEVSLAHYIYP